MAQPADSDGDRVWRLDSRISTGFDVFTQTYQLALEDTTETISEMDATLDMELGTIGRRIHNWSFSPRLGVGSERNREALDFGYVFKPDRRLSRFRVTGTVQARQYRKTTDYNLSSDNRESDIGLRWLPVAGPRRQGELRLDFDTLDYTTPSTLEANRREAALGAYLKSGTESRRLWRVGVRGGRRVYPDSSAIDRDIVGVEFEYDRNSFLGPNLRVHYRGERREVSDPDVRPSSWGHWSSLEATLPVEDMWIVADLRNEIWRYDAQWGAYSNQLRWTGSGGVRGGGLGGPGWRILLTYQDLDSQTGDESFRQLGIRGGLEHFGDRLSGDLTLEAGRRNYEATVDSLGLDDPYALYSDFTYLESWLTGSWRFNDHLSLDAMINYMPERHSADMDDQAMGFGNIRILYRF